MNHTMQIQGKYWLYISMICFLLLSSCGIFRKSGSENEQPEKKKKTALLELEKEKKHLLQKKYAPLLNLPHTEIKNLQLYSLIDDWYGIPYKYGGKTKEGIDCSNFVTLIFNSVYNRNISANSNALHQMCDSINTNDLKEGDLVFFKIEQEKISHLGFYLANGRFIHATSKKGIMINNLEETYYRKHFFSAGRLK